MPKKVTLAVAGLGTVGSAVLRQLRDNADVVAARCGGRRVEVVAVSARDRNRDRGVALDGLAWHRDALELADVEDVDIVVELVGGEDGVARALIEKALRAGRHVVTANKAACAHHGVAFAELAQAGGVQLRFEAAIAGGVPVVKSIKEALAGNRIRELRGILNGTC
ncbi:MAG: homoserine dehydrogenase, partial [Hyphomicrobiales bacterium]|nr:homoserine dehydrogenase [Hyphomicrobiales bacterium]